MDVVPLLSSYSSMAVNYTDVSSSGTSYLIESYNTVYTSASTYKVNITYSTSGETGSTLAWILKNGTIVAADVSGYNVTGSEAQDFAVGIFAGFIEQIEVDSQLSQNTVSTYFHSTGTSTVTIGNVSMQVTTWAANTLPETTNVCGVTSTITAFSLEVGTPPGASSPLVVYEHIAGSSDGSNYDVTITITSFTLA